MSHDTKRQSCLDAETLAAFAEGNLTRQEIAPALAHLRGCADCMADVEALRPRVSRQWPARLLSVAAAIALVVSAALFLRNRIAPQGLDPMQRLVALTPRSARIVEPRLTGGFAWAPYRGPLRADTSGVDAERLQLAGAAGDAVARADREAGAEAQRTAGIALLLVEKPDDALVRLRAATERASSSAESWSDLGAALDEVAVRRSRPSLLPEALAALDRALALRSGLPEALFNRALVLEHLGLTTEAGKTWEGYLRIDASSRWATEARDHLRRLPVSTGDARFRQEQPRIERAALAGDVMSIDTFVAQYPQQSRAFGEAEYLGCWGEAMLRGDDRAARDALTIARAIGLALARHSGESLLRDAVQAIDGVDGTRRRLIAQAHAVYRHGRIALSKQQPGDAEPELRNAAALFGRSGDPMSLVARYFAACARYERDDVVGARAELTALLAETSARHVALGAQVRWQLALTSIADADWGSALATLNEAEAMFRALGERSNLGFIRGMQSMSMNFLGRPDEAWAALIDAFTLASGEGRGDRLPATLGGAARTELNVGRFEPARALLRLEIAADRDAHAGVLLTNALVREAMLSAELGEGETARRDALEAQTIADGIADSALRDYAEADASLGEGAAVLSEDPRRASALLTRAVDFYRQIQRPWFLPQAELLRARAALRLGDREAALRDVDDGITLIERHRVHFAGPVVGTDVLDAGIALGREAIRLRLDAGDVAGAFDAAERRHREVAGDGDRPRVTMHELQRRLAGSDTAVLVVAMLPSELATICLTDSGVTTARVPVDERTLATHVERAASDLRESAALYDLLLRPVQSSISRARRLIVVPDPSLQQVPYAALYDAVAKRYLVEDLAVAVAESASSLRLEDGGRRPQSLLAVSLPSGAMATLPDAQQELGDIAVLYSHNVLIEARTATLQAVRDAIRSADVVHIAGHTSHPGGGEDLALQFNGDGGLQRVSWREVTTLPLAPAAVVVVAGCETLRRPDVLHTRALSLGGGFLAAGASDVIGTLTPVADRDARDFFRAVHRRIAGGLPAIDALRQTQLDAIAAETTTGQRTPWRSVALLTNRIARVSR